MYRDVFINNFSILGCEILSCLDNSLGYIDNSHNLISKAVIDSFASNDLFTPAMQHVALRAIALSFLNEALLNRWTLPYSDKISQQDSLVLVVMAGNLPLVGFHDFLTVVASGRKAILKLSSKDNFLLPALVQILFRINRYWESRILFTQTIEISPTFLIATGGDQTAAFFKKKFGNISNLIRGAKRSVVVLNGNESDKEIEALGKDLFLYFGMGCRSVSTLVLPDRYDIDKLALKLACFSEITKESRSFASAYRYQKALSSMKKEWFCDGGFFIFKNDGDSPPPLSVVGIVHYCSLNELNDFLKTNENALQCIVNYEWNGELVRLGEAQNPSLDNYADGVNSLEFLLKNN